MSDPRRQRRIHTCTECAKPIFCKGPCSQKAPYLCPACGAKTKGAKPAKQ